jgi:hypothetical protein
MIRKSIFPYFFRRRFNPLVNSDENNVTRNVMSRYFNETKYNRQPASEFDIVLNMATTPTHINTRVNKPIFFNKDQSIPKPISWLEDIKTKANIRNRKIRNINTNLFKTAKKDSQKFLETVRTMERIVSKTFFKNLNTSKSINLLEKIAKHKNWAVFGGIVLGVGAAIGQFNELKHEIFPGNDNKVGAIGSGPGYNTWAKSSGVPYNNLNSDGIGLALSKMRHSSIF